MQDKVSNTAGPDGADASARADNTGAGAQPGAAAPAGRASVNWIAAGSIAAGRIAAGMAAAAARLRAKISPASPDEPSSADTAAPANEKPDAPAKPEYIPALPAGKRKPVSGEGGDTAKPGAAKKSPAGNLVGNLEADDRVRQTAERSERLLWAGAAAATLIYALLIAGQMAGFSIFVPSEEVQRQRERRGQGAPDSISVEIVPDPDHQSTTTKWRDGTDIQAEQPTPQPPQAPQEQVLAEPVPDPQPEQKPVEDKAAEEKSEDKPKDEKTDKPRDADSPMLLDIDSLVDAAAQDLKRQIDTHYDEKKQRRQQRRQQQAAAASGAMQIRGTGASGRSDPFTRSVLAALMKTRPGPYALWGRVLVSFQIAESGNLLYVHVLQSSGNSAMDDAAVDAIKRARFKKPPPGLTPNDRTYIIDYIFG
jgi:TonB family protein